MEASFDSATASLLADEFSTGSRESTGRTYLNTASHGLLPSRTADAVRESVTDMAAGRIDMPRYFAVADEARASFARLAGTTPDRVALGSAVSTHVGLIAASLPVGAEVLVADGDFSSVVNPFTVRDDLKLRTAPLERLAEAVDATTALVAVSAVQSADGRVADLGAIREAARAAGARTLVDSTQAVGWFPLRADDHDYVVSAAYKWLLCPRGTSFLVVSEEAQDARVLLPQHAGWVAGERPWENAYGPVARYAPDARRYDESPAFLPYLGAARSLALVERVGRDAIGAHDRALARRFRAGVAGLGARAGAGYEAVPGDSAIAAVPGLGGAAGLLAEAGVVASARDGNLRVAFHLYNTEADVDRLLNVLADGRS
ncbi:aminotransferase class V-fold PLP-dependent enzyme [Streptomyces sp. NPDC048172]|uniref:aminotransferase class V-fold PLP-dependent enzyme n=1 Tax=Streptomyces sp. NPDC048172 TaxID=3365505 RepID=UPI0037243066